MNMKAIMFAGVGLFASMSATTMWISSDLAAIKEREAAKRAAACATTPEGTAAVPAAAATAIDPVTGLPAASAAAQVAPVSGTCPARETGASTSGATAIDPVTGQQIPADPTGGSMPTDSFDPATGGPTPSTSDPAYAGDPNASAAELQVEPLPQHGSFEADAAPVGY